VSVYRIVLVLVLVVSGCAGAVPVARVDELAGAWSGRVTNPAGHAAAAMTVAPDGAFRGMMYLDGGDREFRGGLVVVRPGEVRYRSTDGTGTVRVSDEQGRRVLKFFRDDGGVDAVFRR
jgi:hypothetical protein